MPSQMRRGMSGTPKHGKAGTQKLRAKVTPGYVSFGPLTQGLSASNMPKASESYSGKMTR